MNKKTYNKLEDGLIFFFVIFAAIIGIWYLINTPEYCKSSNRELLNRITTDYHIGCYAACVDRCSILKEKENFTDDCYTVCVGNDC